MKKKNIIIQIINEHPYPVFSFQEYETIISEVNSIWGYRSMPRKKIKEILANEKLIKSRKTRHLDGNEFSFFYKPELENKITVFDVASIRSRKAYFSFFSALFINSLTLQIPKVIHLSLERTKRYEYNSNNTITQTAVDKSFKKKPRISKDIRYYQNNSVMYLNRQFQNNIGIVSYKGIYKVTDLERTLIDCVTRPFYAGETTQILDAFKTAKSLLNTEKFIQYFSAMKFTYPYQNAIGFYLELAGYPEEIIRHFYGIRNTNIKFYLTYDIHLPELSQKWSIYHPKNIS